MKKPSFWWLPAVIVLGFLLGAFAPNVVSLGKSWTSRLDDPNPAVRAAAVRDASRQGNVALLIEAVKDEDADVRLLAVEHLWGRGPLSADIAKALVSALNDDYACVRREAIYVFGSLDAEAWPAVREALQNDNPRVRSEAVEALFTGGRGKEGGHWATKVAGEIVPILTDMKDDPDADVRAQVERALARLSRR